MTRTNGHWLKMRLWVVTAMSLAMLVGCSAPTTSASAVVSATGGAPPSAAGSSGAPSPSAGTAGNGLGGAGLNDAGGGGAVGGDGGDGASVSGTGGVAGDATMDGGLGNAGSTMVADPGTDGDGTFAIAAPFKAAAEMSDQPGVNKGQLVSFTMQNSKTFGDGARKVAVYLPAGYVSGSELPFIVAQDGVNPQNGGSFGLDDLRPLLDNMIAGGRLPMMAGIFVDPANERSVEYDTVSDRYYQFVESELLPEAAMQVQQKTGLTLNLTKDPEGRCAFGGSSGGAAAFTMGWFHPEAFARILTISGSFVSLQTSAQYPDGAAGYAQRLIPGSAAKSLRVFLEAGSNDIGGGRWRAGNDAMAKALAAKQYHYRYLQAQGAAHEDDAARRQYLPDAMAWVWRGYPIHKP